MPEIQEKYEENEDKNIDQVNQQNSIHKENKINITSQEKNIIKDEVSKKLKIQENQHEENVPFTRNNTSYNDKSQQKKYISQVSRQERNAGTAHKLQITLNKPNQQRQQLSEQNYRQQSNQDSSDDITRKKYSNSDGFSSQLYLSSQIMISNDTNGMSQEKPPINESEDIQTTQKDNLLQKKDLQYGEQNDRIIRRQSLENEQKDLNFNKQKFKEPQIQNESLQNVPDKNKSKNKKEAFFIKQNEEEDQQIGNIIDQSNPSNMIQQLKDEILTKKTNRIQKKVFNSEKQEEEENIQDMKESLLKNVDSEQLAVIKSALSFNRQNANKNIIKAFQKYVNSTQKICYEYKKQTSKNYYYKVCQNEEIIINDKPSPKDLNQFFKKFNKFIQNKTYTNQHIKQIIQNRIYGQILFSDFLNNNANIWLENANVLNKESYQTIINFYKLCCTNQSFLVFLNESSSIQSQNALMTGRNKIFSVYKSDEQKKLEISSKEQEQMKEGEQKNKEDEEDYIEFEVEEIEQNCSQINSSKQNLKQDEAQKQNQVYSSSKNEESQDNSSISDHLNQSIHNMLLKQQEQMRSQQDFDQNSDQIIISEQKCTKNMDSNLNQINEITQNGLQKQINEYPNEQEQIQQSLPGNQDYKQEE